MNNTLSATGTRDNIKTMRITHLAPQALQRIVFVVTENVTAKTLCAAGTASNS